MTTQPSEMDVLKAQVKTLKRIVYGFGCLLVVGIVLNARSESKSIPDLIQAKMFQVVNDEGKIGVLTAMGPDGGVLVILDEDGKGVAGLSSESDGGFLQINDNDGKVVFEKP